MRHPVRDEGTWAVIVALGITQITAWGSIYYSFGFLLQPYQAALGVSREGAAAAFTLALLTSGCLSTTVGTLIDRFGGRWVMTAGSVGAAALLASLSRVDSLMGLYAVYIGLGVVMACTLYEPAFAVLVQSFRSNARRAITFVTLFGGLASTVFWPLTQLLVARYGWRDALLVLGALNLTVCVPLHFVMLPKRAHEAHETVARRSSATGPLLRDVVADRVFLLLCAALVGYSLVFSAMSVHMMSILQAKGLTAATAAGIGAMVGPMQVLGRVLELVLANRVPIIRVGVVAMILLPVSLALFRATTLSLVGFGAFALIYGAANGVMTIVRGNIVAELYGRQNYGRINGALAAPALVATAVGPLVAAWLWARLASHDALVLVLIAVAAGAALLFGVAARAGQRRDGLRPGAT